MPHYRSNYWGFEVRPMHKQLNSLMQLKCLPAKLPGVESRKITGSQLHKSFVCMSVTAEAESHKINAKTGSQSNHRRIHQKMRLLTLLLWGGGRLYQNMFMHFIASNRTLLTYTFPILKIVTSDSFYRSSNFTLFSSSIWIRYMCVFLYLWI